ncbi:MAG: transposase [Verrucomicrobiota bacterium]|nr:transposase [Verrucomicrobiota bacterium]
MASAAILHGMLSGVSAAVRRKCLIQRFDLRPNRCGYTTKHYLEVLRLAYNLVTAFQRTCLPPPWQELTLGKLRHRLFWLPGELTRPQNRPTLRLPDRPAVQEWSARILRQVHKLKPLDG